MIGPSTWKLPERIIELSNADTWAIAKTEWFPDGVEMLEAGEDSRSCLCTKYPIRELCYIRNRENEATAIVGNKCIKKFSLEEGVDPKFKKIGNIFDAMKRIRADATSSANSALIQYAFDQEVFSKKDMKFYNSIWRKRSLSTGQSSYKDSLNRKLLNNIILSAKACFARLVKDKHQTAGKKLIAMAREREVITEWESSFATGNINRLWSSMSERQRPHRLRINEKILRGLDPIFNPST